jgi:hypothetical protein
VEAVLYDFFLFLLPPLPSPLFVRYQLQQADLYLFCDRRTVGLGIVPAAMVLLWRLRMPRESDRYKQSAIKTNVPYGLVARRYWKSFLGVSLCWFIYDLYVPLPF